MKLLSNSKAKKTTKKDLKNAVIERLYKIVNSSQYLTDGDVRLLEILLRKKD